MKRLFAHIPGVHYPELAPGADKIVEVAASGGTIGEPAEFNGDHWWYVVTKDRQANGVHRIFGIFPVKAWAESWLKQFAHPDKFEVKQILKPE